MNRREAGSIRSAFSSGSRAQDAEPPQHPALLPATQQPHYRRFYGFSDKARTYYYLGAFDPKFHLLSPGTLLVGHAIEQALKEGHKEFHFLRGREDYKYKWGATDRLTYRRLLRLKPQPPVETERLA